MIKSKLKVMLAMREMTQTELAEKTGIKQPTISVIANSNMKRIPVDALNKICKELQCNVGDLFEYVEAEE